MGNTPMTEQIRTIPNIGWQGQGEQVTEQKGESPPKGGFPFVRLVDPLFPLCNLLMTNHRMTPTRYSTDMRGWGSIARMNGGRNG